MSHVVDDGWNVMILLKKLAPQRVFSIRDTNHWPLLPWGPTSCKRSVLPTSLSVAELEGLSLLIPTFSHATDSTALTSEQHQHRPGGTQGVHLPRNLPEASCARLLASIFWAIYCSPEVFQVSLGFRCNGWSVLGTLLQGAGNASLYPSDYRVSRGKGMWARMAPPRCQRHTGNYVQNHNTKYSCSL